MPTDSTNVVPSTDEDFGLEAIRQAAESLRHSSARKTNYTEQQLREYDYSLMNSELVAQWEAEAEELKLTENECTRRTQLLRAVLNSSKCLDSNELAQIHVELVDWLNSRPDDKKDKGAADLLELLESQQKLASIRNQKHM